MHLLAGKNKGYKGPKTHHEIITTIYREINKRSGNRWISRRSVERIVKLFFRPTGIGLYFKNTRDFFIKGVGYFKFINRPEKLDKE